jgi:hypothetical protein
MIKFIIGGFAFIGFTVVLSIIYVYWNDLFGGHDE